LLPQAAKSAAVKGAPVAEIGAKVSHTWNKSIPVTDPTKNRFKDGYLKWRLKDKDNRDKTMSEYMDYLLEFEKLNAEGYDQRK